ncbi:hypothetical protein HHK36_025988 [Tetracentron sinense]|uniref:Uncharacterized protein n=1 Tax=Tetracentron sinense TaxID=13715 RepID=A0A834YM77_TETSI|nr:hypothetical protein HHK36_025988 [Tetracentron sinense]
MDRNEYYGGESTSLSVYLWRLFRGDDKPPDELGSSKDYNVDMNPKLGGFFIWSYTYHLVRSSAMAYKALQEAKEFSQIPNKDLDANGETQLLKGEDQKQVAILVPSTNSH